MASLTSILPAPKHSVPQYTPDAVAAAVDSITKKGPPPYGQRQGWVPRSLDDFGDGGAFPEIHVAQYPKDMGRKNKTASNRIVAVKTDTDGNVKYDAIVDGGRQRNGKTIYSSATDLIVKDGLEESELAKPDDDEIAETTKRTKKALEDLVQKKTSAAQPVIKGIHTTAPEATYIKYTPSTSGGTANAGAMQRVIRMQETAVDPLEPPKFKHKRVPKGPPSPPVPVMHSPPRKLTAKDQADWKIPPCISNWKNAKGYTIPLDKRLAADGRGLQETHINDNFAKLSEALYVAERTAREEVEKRAMIQKKLMQKEKEKKEEELRRLAEEARRARAGGPAAVPDTPSGEIMAPASERETPEEREQRLKREAIREERRRERERDRRMEASGYDKRAKTGSARDRDRDVSEKIALGQAAATSSEYLYDQRLFNQTQGMSSGFGQEDSYNLYDKPLFGGSSTTKLYKPSRGEDGEDETAASSSRGPRPDKDFSGVDRSKQSGPRDRPVEFEKDADDDPFGLNSFLTEAKKGKAADSGGSMAFAAGASFSESAGRTDRKMEFAPSRGGR
eukprot:tig00000944_g5945.t1